MATIEARKQALAVLEKEFETLRDQIARERHNITEAEARFEVGSEVTYKRGGRRWTGRIERIAGLTAGYTCYLVTPFLASGNDGRPVHITDWQYDDMQPVVKGGA